MDDADDVQRGTLPLGDLDRRVGGPSVFPDLPPGVNTRGGWERSKEERDRNRRSLYVFVRRNLKYPLFDAFDEVTPLVIYGDDGDDGEFDDEDFDGDGDGTSDNSDNGSDSAQNGPISD